MHISHSEMFDVKCSMSLNMSTISMFKIDFKHYHKCYVFSTTTYLSMKFKEATNTVNDIAK